MHLVFIIIIRKAYTTSNTVAIFLWRPDFQTWFFQMEVNVPIVSFGSSKFYQKTRHRKLMIRSSPSYIYARVSPSKYDKMHITIMSMDWRQKQATKLIKNQRLIIHKNVSVSVERRQYSSSLELAIINTCRDDGLNRSWFLHKFRIWRTFSNLVQMDW